MQARNFVPLSPRRKRALRTSPGRIKNGVDLFSGKMNKAELRTAYLEKRRALSSSEAAEKSRLVADRLFDSFDLGAFKTIHCFISIAKLNELDTSLIFGRLWKEFPAIRTVAPRVENEIVSVPYGPETQLIESRWGIREPAGTGIPPSEIDAVFVPGICFDRQAHRVGYGKGYYDRFLSKCRPDCAKIGLSLFPLIEVIDDVGPHDVALDSCVTPETLIDFRSN